MFVYLTIKSFIHTEEEAGLTVECARMLQGAALITALKARALPLSVKRDHSVAIPELYRLVEIDSETYG